MSRKLRRVVRSTALTSGGLTLAGTGMGALLVREAKVARRKVEEKTPVDDPPTGNGVWGSGPGDPIVMAILGDSSAVGLGVESVNDTPGVLVAKGLSQLARRPVRLVRVAVSGAESKDLDKQVTDVLAMAPDIAVIMIGANDVTSRTKVSVSVRYLSDAVRRLRDRDIEVVVGTCPDLGTVRPIPQPLRLLARRWSRQMSAAQVIGVVEADGRTVSLGDVLGPVFARYTEMWSHDGFHPSEAGYAAAASVMLPSVADALGYWPIPRDIIGSRSHVTRPVELAAAKASHRPGSEVTPIDSRIELKGRRPLAVLRRLLPIRLPSEADHPQDPSPGSADVPPLPHAGGTTTDQVKR